MLVKRRKTAANRAAIELTTYRVTVVRAGPPFIEPGAYAYTAENLPTEGETITVTSILSPWGPRLHEIRARVTRVDPKADTPISAAEFEADRPHARAVTALRAFAGSQSGQHPHRRLRAGHQPSAAGPGCERAELADP